MLHDLKHAVRMLWQSKGWTLVVLLSLALGIGANTALFTAVNGLLLQTLAVPNPGELVRLKTVGDNNMRRSSSDYGFSEPYQGRNVRSSFSLAIYQQLRASNQTLTDITAFAPYGNLNLSVDGASELAPSQIVSGNFFKLLQVPVSMGRPLDDSDDQAGAAPAAVISDALWKRRFGGKADAIGKTVRVNNVPVTIVGVTPASFTGVQRLGTLAPELTVPLVLDAQFSPANAKRNLEPTNYWVLLMGRLKPGATLAQVKGNLEGPFQSAARGGMEAYMNGLTDEQRKLSTNQRRGDAVSDFLAQSASRGVYDLDTTTTRSASILAGIVSMLLLIVCANVANLLLSRAAARRKEVAVRLSMGAPRRRLIRQLLTESLMLSGIGGVLGIAVAYWSKKLLPFGENVGMDWSVFGFVAAVSIATGVIFGILPALRATQIDLASTMKESSRSVTGARGWLSRGLLVTQVAMSVMLLIGAGLCLRTLSNLRSVDVGFNTNNLLMFRVNPLLNGYAPERLTRFVQDTQRSLEALPGVRAVAMTRVVPLSGSTNITGMYVQGQTQTRAHDIYAMQVSPTFFATMEIPLVLGRGFTEADDAKPVASAIINETAVKKFFNGQNPIGQRIGQSLEQNGETEIIGVVRDTKYNSLRDDPPPTLYRSLGTTTGSATVLMRTAMDPASLIETMRATMNTVDPDVPVTGVSTQTEQVENRFAQERLFAMAYSLFGALALLLASIGLFGLMSYNVSRRTNEIGIRMALGAQRSGVVGMVLQESMVMVAAGVVIGLAGAIAGGRFIESVLFGLTTTDVMTISAAITVTLLVSLFAGYIPARRASRVDPMVALRYE